MRGRNGFAAAVVATIMIATGGLATWLVASSGVLVPQAAAGDRPSAAAAPQQSQPSDSSVELNTAFQLSQPRDPFRPLVTEDSPPGLIPGVGGTPGSGDDGGTFDPGNTITLQEIRVVAGELVATIVVNGVTYEVSEGDTFAGSFKVIELTEDSALLQYGDIVFELKVGQSILK